MAKSSITFSEKDVRAILEGRKRQFRKPLNAQPEEHSPIVELDTEHSKLSNYWLLKTPYHGLPCDGLHIGGYLTEVPYLPETEIWVREAFAVIEGNVQYRADFPGSKYPGVWDDALADQIHHGGPKRLARGIGPRWCSPFHMPRNLSRITLRVTEV